MPFREVHQLDDRCVQPVAGEVCPKRWIAILIIVVSVGVIFAIGMLLPSELAPMEDKGRFTIMSTAPEGTSFEVMDRYANQIIAIVDTLPEKTALIAVTSPGLALQPRLIQAL